jgi:Tat protein translocase TatB subunit
MFGVSFTELVMVFIVALLLFGPEQLPQMARQLGKLMAELRKGSDAVRREFYNSVYPPADEITRDLASTTKDLRALKSEFLSSPLPKLEVPTVGELLSPSQSPPETPTTENKLPPGGGRAAPKNASTEGGATTTAGQNGSHTSSQPLYEDDKGDA